VQIVMHHNHTLDGSLVDLTTAENALEATPKSA
jgi:hypothetical protein